MDDPLPVDLFMTKSVEYLLVIGFLVAFLLFWRILARRKDPVGLPSSENSHAATPSGWFGFPLDRLFHPGHGWVRPDPDGLVTLGIDDFAQKLVGRPESIALPGVGESITRGGQLSRLAIGDKTIETVSPLDGEVVERNQAVIDRPELLEHDPYGKGWLVRLQPTRFGSNSEELLQGNAVRTWMRSVEESLQRRMSPSFGLLLQDGGVPVSGIARALAGEDWDRLARDYLSS